jgi:hypothetical protein
MTKVDITSKYYYQHHWHHHPCHCTTTPNLSHTIFLHVSAVLHLYNRKTLTLFANWHTSSSSMTISSCFDPVLVTFQHELH